MSWWDTPDEKPHIYEIKSIPTHCPVCKVFLGDRFEGMLFSAHCGECKTTFRFLPGATSPSSELDSAVKKDCGCTYCRPADEEDEE